MPEGAGWFFDSVTLSNFALAGALDLLAARYRRRGFMVTQVVDELSRGAAAGHAALAGCLDLADQGVFGIVSLDRAERRLYRQLISHLGAGEAATIAAARHRRGTVATDDLAARRACGDLGVPLTGTIGILRAAVHDGSLSRTDGDAALGRMIAAGFHAPVRRLGG